MAHPSKIWWPVWPTLVPEEKEREYHDSEAMFRLTLAEESVCGSGESERGCCEDDIEAPVKCRVVDVSREDFLLREDFSLQFGAECNSRGSSMRSRDGAVPTVLLLAGAFACLLPGAVAAKSQLRVASCNSKETHHPPYTFPDLANGLGQGFEHDLWHGVYRRMIYYAARSGDGELVSLIGDGPPPVIVMDKTTIADSLRSGAVDIGLCALVTTPDAGFHFAPAYLQTGMQGVIKLNPAKEVNFMDLLINGIFKPFRNVYAQASLLMILYFAIIVAHTIWFLERRDNSAAFNSAYGPGIIDAVWFAMVTALTVGYGDKVPLSIVGKLVAVIWMVIAAFFVGIFAAALTSGFIVSDLKNESPININNVTDLAKYSVGVMSALAYATLRDEVKGILHLKQYSTDMELLNALVKGEIEVAVQDSNTARYMANMEPQFTNDVEVRGLTFLSRELAIGISKRNGTYAPIYSLLSESVYDFTSGSGRHEYKHLLSKWFGTTLYKSTAMSPAIEVALSSSNLYACLVLVGLAVVWGAAVLLHYRYEIREAIIRDKLRRVLGLGSKFNLVDLRKGAERLFDKHDTDKSGTLDVQEILKVLQSLGKDVDLEDVRQYIDRELENRADLGGEEVHTRSRNSGNEVSVPTDKPSARNEVYVPIKKPSVQSEAKVPHPGKGSSIDELLAEIDEEPPPLPSSKSAVSNKVAPDGSLPDGEVSTPRSDIVSPGKAFMANGWASMASMGTLTTSITAAMVDFVDEDLEEKYAHTQVTKQEFVRIIEGLIMDEEDDEDAGVINPHGQVQQKHLLHHGAEMVKHMDDMHAHVNERVDRVSEEVSVLVGKMELLLEALNVGPERIKEVERRRRLEVEARRQSGGKSPYPRGSKFEGRAPSSKFEGRAASILPSRVASHHSQGPQQRSLSRSSLLSVSIDQLDR